MNSERILAALLILLSTFVLYREAIGRNAMAASESMVSAVSSSTGPAGQTMPDDAAQFAIMGMTTSETSYDYYSISHRYKYAVKHNYDLVFDFEPSSGHGKSWDKLNITRDTIQKVLSGERQYQWVWMLDYDTLITNSAVKLEELVEKALAFAEKEGKSRHAIQMILTRDCEPLNAGSMIFKATPWMLEMIEKWRAHKVIVDPDEGDRLDQGSLKDMIEKNVFSAAERSVIVPQTWMNSYPEELTCYDPRDKALERPWKRGDFVIHFAGAAWHHKDMQDPIGTFMRKYHQLAD